LAESERGWWQPEVTYPDPIAGVAAFAAIVDVAGTISEGGPLESVEVSLGGAIAPLVDRARIEAAA
jgi:hypothetical protein